MVSKLFLDTNILLDFFLGREGELFEIEEIFDSAQQGSVECYISESVLATSIYFLQKEKRKNVLQMVRNVLTILTVLPFHHEVLSFSLESFDDIEDGLLFFLARFHKLDFFITRNVKDFKNAPSGLPVITPAQFIKYSK